MIDKFHFQSPFGVLGKLANFLFLEQYMLNLLSISNKYLKLKQNNLPSLNIVINEFPIFR